MSALSRAGGQDIVAAFSDFCIVNLAQPLDSLYIAPHLLLFPNLAELYQPLDGANYFLQVEREGRLEFDSLLSFKRLLVLAEPGYGKSELLKQIGQAYLSDACKQIICKELKSKTVEEYLGDTDDQHALQYVLFDALDEVDANFTADTILRIQTFADSHQRVTVIISCRIHYLFRFQVHFTGLETFKFLKINPFFDSDIRRYLMYYLPSEEDAIEQVIQKTRVSNYKSILTTPRYLRAFIVAIKNDSIRLEELANLKIIDLFDKLIYHKLEDDAHKSPGQFSKNEIELTRRVLEKLSLIMEIYQTNSITKEELITVLDETISNVNLIFLNYSSIDTFIDRILKQTDDKLEFEHTEFQEYLSARHLVRMANKEQALYDLILDPDLQHIYPGWYDVLRFAVEISPDIILNLTRYLSYRQNFQVDEKLIEIIVSITPEQLPEVDRAFLFSTLTGYYERSGQYVGQRYFRVAQFYLPSLNVDFTGVLPEEGLVNRALGNRTDIIRGIVSAGKMTAQHSAVWMQFLITKMAETESDDIVEKLSFALEVFDAFDALKGLWPAITGRIDKVVQNYMIGLFRMKPDDPFCLTVLFYVIEYRQQIDVSDMMDKLSGSANLNVFFDFLLANPENLQNAFRGESSYRAYYHVFEEIAAVNDRELDKKVVQVFSGLLNAHDHYHLYGAQRQFVEHTLGYFWYREPSFLSQLLQLNNAAYFLSEYGNVIVDKMNLADFVQIKNFLSKEERDWELRTIIAKLKVFGDQGRQQLQEEIRSAYPEYFEERIYQPQEPENNTAKEDAIYREYQGYLQLLRINNLVYEDIFPFVYHNWNILSDRSTPEETEQVKTLLIRTLEWLDPEKFSLVIERSGNRSSYAHNSPNWFRFDLLINLALSLGVTDAVNKYRHKIIIHLPLIDNYMSNAAKLGNIIQQLEPITTTEVQALLDFCMARKDDYIYSSIMTFIDLIREQQLSVFAPVLTQFIEDQQGKTDLGEKSKALDAYAAVTRGTVDGKNYLQKTFDERQGQLQADVFLRQRANAHLISFYEDDAAIAWRIDQLKEKVMRVDENTVTLSRRVNYTASMNEMEQPTYGKCFTENPSKKLVRPMFELLATSFELLKQSDARRYSNYLQRIVFDYFNAVKTVSLINQLRVFVDEEKFESRGASFKYLLKQLEMNFIEEHKKFTNIAEAVQSFNELNAKRYLRIRDEADLTHLLRQVINEDIRNVIENEGFYHVAQRLAGNLSYKRSGHIDEDMIQRTLKIIFENALLKRGLRAVDIYREPELLDGKRYDYLIKYGFIGPVVVELKRLDNDEVTDPKKRRAYKNKIKQYLNGVNSDNGFYVIFKVLDDVGDKAKTQFEELIKEYQDVKGLYIEYLDCWEPASELLSVKKQQPVAAQRRIRKKNP